MGLKIFCIIIISISFYQCNGKADGIIYEKYPDGTISAEIPYLIIDGDTLINGAVLFYYHNGIIQDKFNCINDRKNGWHLKYDSLGRLKKKVMYRNDKVIGKSFSYYNSGNIEVEELRLNDSIIMLKNFYPNGQLQIMDVFLSNKYVKYYITYDSSGRIIDEHGILEPYDTLLY